MFNCTEHGCLAPSVILYENVNVKLQFAGRCSPRIPFAHPSNESRKKHMRISREELKFGTLVLKTSINHNMADPFSDRPFVDLGM